MQDSSWAWILAMDRHNRHFTCKRPKAEFLTGNAPLQQVPRDEAAEDDAEQRGDDNADEREG